MYDQTTLESVNFVVKGMADIRRLDEYYRKISEYRPEIDRKHLREDPETHFNYLVEVVNSIYECTLDKEKKREKGRSEETIKEPKYTLPFQCYR